VVALEEGRGDDSGVGALGGGVGGGYGASDGGVNVLDPGDGGWEELCWVSTVGMKGWRGRVQAYGW